MSELQETLSEIKLFVEVISGRREIIVLLSLFWVITAIAFFKCVPLVHEIFGSFFRKVYLLTHLG